jgi:sporulation protein YlmC with PRC-barrel domain
MRLDLGTPIHATDEVVGELGDVVIDPVEKRITHLVVKPHHGPGEARLLPVELVAGDDERGLSVRCTAEDVRRLPNIEELAYLRVDSEVLHDPEWDVGVTDVLALPYYESGGYGGALEQDISFVVDRVAKGEVELRRASSVLTADGKYVGDVDGFLVDGDHITHFVLERGHLWGRREVTVPIGAVAKVESDSVTVDLSMDEIGALPTHRVHRLPWQRKTSV